MNRDNSELDEKLRKLARSYVPEWSFSEGDAGSAVALLFSQMLAESRGRYGRVLHKHKLQYLNLFDRYKEEPLEPARGYVRFLPAAGSAEPIHIPKGTRLLADSEVGQIVFETSYGITACTAEPEAVYTTGGDVIIEQALRQPDGSLPAFQAFGLTGENRAEHLLLLGFNRLFDECEALNLSLSVETFSEEEREQALSLLSSSRVCFSMLGTEGAVPFDRVEREGDTLRLVMERYTPCRTPICGRERYVLQIAADGPLDLRLSGLSLEFSGDELSPDEITCQGISQNPARFYPFGAPMEIYAEWRLESRRVFARRGARAELCFEVDSELVEQLLPEYEIDPDYRLVMRKPAAQAHPVPAEVWADQVLFEYLSPTGWKRLLGDEYAGLFREGGNPAVRLDFTVPEDISDPTDEPRMRVRLLRAERLYQMPVRQHCPVVGNPRFSFTYAGNPQRPDCLLTRNNFTELDATSALREGRAVQPFYSREHERPALYLGFSKSPAGAAESLFFQLENDTDCPVDFTAEYLGPGGFAPLKVADYTDGMRYAETILFSIPSDIVPGTRFGRELYWLRLLCHGRELSQSRLPVVRAILPNMVRVVNVNTQVSYFYLDEGSSEARFSLGKRDLLAASVYVNEAGADPENWVLWERTAGSMAQGRVYSLDFSSGELTFPKNAFAAFPVREDGPGVKVVYQSYHGSDANVPAGAIHTLAGSIRHISGVENPWPAYGGYDSYNEQTAARGIANLLRTRNRVVSERDYFDILSQSYSGVRRIKCCTGVGLDGEPKADQLTIAILIDQYEQGSQLFAGMKEAARQKLLSCSGLLPMGKELVLTQPLYVRMSVRMWVECERMEDAYELQKECAESIARFIDPLAGGFNGSGWEIGELPTEQGLRAYLKNRHPGVLVDRIVMTARFGNREFAVDGSIRSHIENPFAMAVNGEHVVYADLAEG